MKLPIRGLASLSRGVLFTILLIWGAFCTIFFLLPVVLLVPFHYIRVIRWRRKWADYIVAIYYNFVFSLVKLIGGTKIYIYCDSQEIMSDRGALIISNQRTRADWLYSGFCYSYLTGRTSELKVVSREFLKSIPIFGWVRLYCIITMPRN